MRINKYLAQATGMSRRAADRALQEGRVRVNGLPAAIGQEASEQDRLELDGHAIGAPLALRTIMLHKPDGFVVSRDGQGNRTVYDLIPDALHNLKPVGRLDKNSSGLLLMTSDGQLAQELTHPSRQKTKVYEVELGQPLAPLHRQMIAEFGVTLDDGPSKLALERVADGNDFAWIVRMREGRNRQIRRTFASLGYTVRRLHRTQFGPYVLGDLGTGKYIKIQP